MATRAKLFSQLAKSVDTSGTITSAGISSTVSLGATVYDSAGQLPTSGYNAGDQAFVISTSRLYINSGVGWYNVAVINNTPIVQSVLDSDGGTTPFSLATDGTPTTITITAVDSDGDPLTYSSTADSDFGGLATISQADNVFTITPFSQDSATTTSGTITFSITDGINIANSGIQTFTLSFLSPLWDETVLSIGTSSTNSLANSTFIDRSTNARTITATGSPVQTAFHPYLDNWSVEFDGASYLNTGGAHIPASGDFTVEFWYMSTDLSHRNDIISQYTAATDGRLAISQINASSGVEFFNSRSGSVVTTTIPKVGEWNHFAYVRDGDTFRAFVNGVQEATGTGSGTIDTATNTYIGFTATQNYTEGFVSDVRISNTARYDANGFAVPGKLSSDANTILLTCQSNRFVDNSSSSNTITLTGNPKVSAFNPFGQGSEYASGENKGSYYNSTNSGTTLQLSNPDTSGNIWECQGWFYLEDFTTFGETALFSTLATTSEGLVIRIFGTQLVSGWNKQINIYGGGASPNNQTATLDLNAYSWFHVLASCDGTNTRVFLDGTLVLTTSASNFGLNNNIRVGHVYYDNNTAPGYYSDFKFQVGGSVTTSDFTPPTSPVGNTNAEIYLPMDNAGIYDKTGNYTLTLSGNTATSTTQTKYSTTSMYFDGSGDGIDFGDQSTLKFLHDQTCDYTIEGWIYPTNITGRRAILMTGAASASAGALLELNGSSIEYTVYRGVSGSFTNTLGGTAVINQWQHIAIAVQGTNIRTFLDGTLINTSTWALAPSTAITQVNPSIGRDTASSTVGDFLGYIENLQIFKGVAKYTTNFTPPIQTQGRQYQAES